MAKSKTEVVTRRVRASYVNVFKPRLNELSGEDEYSMVVLIPKSDKETLRAIEAACDVAVRDKWADKPPAKLRHPIRDPRDDGKSGDPWDGHLFVNVKSKTAPEVVDRDGATVTDERAFLSGDYCRVYLNAYAYDKKGNRGVALGLNAIQVIAKGEPLTSRRRAQDVFDDYQDDDGDTPAPSPSRQAPARGRPARDDWADDVPF